MEIADTIEEIKTVCVWCNNKATINAKYLVDESGEKTIIRNGSTEIDLGAEEKYIPICWNCWK
jgi:thymidine kinase